MRQHHEAVLRLPRKLITKLNTLLAEPDKNLARNEVVFDEEVVFNNGYRMAVRVCASDDPTNESCWSEAILFDIDGHEVSCTPPDAEQIDGEFVCYDRKDEYITIVEAIAPCVAIVGNLSEGFKVVGPYASFDEAATAHDDHDTWIMDLEHPE